MHYIYIVECKGKTFYTGWTTDLVKRIKKHNTGEGAKYTRGRTPVVLKYYEEFQQKSDALKREREIKKMPRSKKNRLIDSFDPKDNFDKLFD